MTRLGAALVCCLCVLGACAVTGAVSPVESGKPQWRPVDEHWYSVEMAGARVGWIAARLFEDDGHYRSVTETRLELQRGAASTAVEMKTTFVETRSGMPVTVEYVQTMGQQPVTTLYRFEEDRVVKVSTQGDRQIDDELPLPDGEWLTPMSARRFRAERTSAGARQITYRTIHAESGLDPIEVRSEFAGEDRVEVAGAPETVTTWKTSNSFMPEIEALETYTAGGLLVSEEVTLPMIGRTVTRLTTRERAMAPAERPELLVATFVKPDRPIRNARRATTVTMRLSVTDGEMPEIPSAGAQHAEPDGEGGVTVTVDVKDPGPAAAEADEYVASSVMIDAEDPLIRALAREALQRVDDFDPRARAEALRAAVHRQITDVDLDTVFATASETAKTGSGDCSEHAVLLAAMLRADGIPARVAIGLIYAERFLGETHIFGWHMWTQALIDGRWVDLDATITAPYHAAHVLTNTSSLDDDIIGAEIAVTLMLMGNLEIEVLDVGYD